CTELTEKEPLGGAFFPLCSLWLACRWVGTDRTAPLSPAGRGVRQCVVSSPLGLSENVAEGRRRLNILGLIAVDVGGHPAACLLKDGRLVALVEEERFVRVKQAPGYFPSHSIR